MKFCGECGTELIQNSKFCNNCGSKIVSNSSSGLNIADTYKTANRSGSTSPPGSELLAKGSAFGFKAVLIIGLTVIITSIIGSVWWLNKDNSASKLTRVADQNSQNSKENVTNVSEPRIDVAALRAVLRDKGDLPESSVKALENESKTNFDAAYLLGEYFNKFGEWKSSNVYLLNAKAGGIPRLDPLIGENFRRLFLLTDSLEDLNAAKSAFASAKSYDPNSNCKYHLLDSRFSSAEMEEFREGINGEIVGSPTLDKFYKQYLNKSTGKKLDKAVMPMDTVLEELARFGVSDNDICRGLLVLSLASEAGDDITDIVDFDAESFAPADIYSTISDGYFADDIVEIMGMSDETYQVDFHIAAKELSIASARNGDSFAIINVMYGYEAEYAKKIIDAMEPLAMFADMDEDDEDDKLTMMVAFTKLIEDLSKIDKDAEYKISFWNKKCQTSKNEDLREVCTDIIDYSRATGTLSIYQQILDEL